VNWYGTGDGEGDGTPEPPYKAVAEHTLDEQLTLERIPVVLDVCLSLAVTVIQPKIQKQIATITATNTPILVLISP
jgi:hypothetical protein